MNKPHTLWTAITAFATAAMAATGIVVALGGGNIIVAPRSEIAKVAIVARMPGTDSESWDGLLKYDAPQVPAARATHFLDDVVKCKSGYTPVAAWHEITGSWPSIDVMYSVNASVTADGRVAIDLRSRDGFDGGYAYVDVIVQCNRG